MLYTFLPLLNPNFAVFPTSPCNNKVPSPNSGPVDAVVVGGVEAVLLSAVTRVVNSIKLVGLAAGKEEDRDDGDDAVDLIEAMDVVFSKQYPVDCLSVKKQACECGVQSLCDSHENNCDSMLTCEDCAVWKRRHSRAAEGFMMDWFIEERKSDRKSGFAPYRTLSPLKK